MENPAPTKVQIFEVNQFQKPTSLSMIGMNGRNGLVTIFDETANQLPHFLRGLDPSDTSVIILLFVGPI